MKTQPSIFRKRIIISLAACLLIFSLAGCGGGPKAVRPTDPAASGKEIREVQGEENAEMGDTSKEVVAKITANSRNWNIYLNKICQNQLGPEWRAVEGSAQLVGAQAHKSNYQDKRDRWCYLWSYCGTATIKGSCQK